MARMNKTILDANDRFPELRLRTVEGAELVLPRDLGPGYGVVLLYRGHW